MTVKELLEASMKAHDKARSRGKAGRPPGWLDDMRDAARLRKAALELDPDRFDLCWSDYGKHDALMGFYRDVEVL